MQHLINQLQHFRFGARSEKLTPDQYALALEDLDVARAEVDALADLSDEAAARARQTRKRRPADAERGSLPGHLPKIEVEILPPETQCPCCGGELHRIDTDEARRLDVADSGMIALSIPG
jgi:transposase